MRRFTIWMTLILSIAVLAAEAATKVTPTNESETLALKPPHTELQPTFLEVHGLQVAACAIVFFAAMGFGIFFLLKPRREIPEPPVVIMRRTLASLRGKEETGTLIMEVSVSLKRYLNTVLGFMPGEKTTVEFCAALTLQTEIPVALATEISDFLKRCDEWKFSQSPHSEKLDAVETASMIVDRVEAALQPKQEAKTAGAIN